MTIMTIISNKKIEIITIQFKYYDYTNAFDKIDMNKLFKHKFYNHAIETKNKILSFDFIYILFITKLQNYRKYLNNNLKKKFIVFFSSFANAFIMFVKKKNENLRLCVSYRTLNFITVKNRYFISLLK